MGKDMQKVVRGVIDKPTFAVRRPPLPTALPSGAHHEFSPHIKISFLEFSFAPQGALAILVFFILAMLKIMLTKPP